MFKRALRVVVIGALGGGIAYGAFIVLVLPGGLRGYFQKRTDFNQLYVYHVGENFIDINFLDLDGKAVRLSQVPHKVILVNFFSSGSGASDAEAPRLEHISQSYRHAGLQVVAVDVNETAETARGYQQKHHLTSPAVLVADKVEGGFFVPFNLVIDQGGVVRFAGTGGQPHDMEDVITGLLGDGPKN